MSDCFPDGARVFGAAAYLRPRPVKAFVFEPFEEPTHLSLSRRPLPCERLHSVESQPVGQPELAERLRLPAAAAAAAAVSHDLLYIT